tara:strand:- start:691 stop:915 length:225 start_codon:yes stop_codon:yes gene_type:complete
MKHLREFNFTGIGREVMQFMEILSRDPDFDINEPITFTILQSVHSEVNGKYSLNDIMFVLMSGSLYPIMEFNNS